jgi:hypothetical protein
LKGVGVQVEDLNDTVNIEIRSINQKLFKAN